MTTPTAAMLEAIQKCSLLDDVFMEDTTTTELEAHVASLAGKEAGLLVLSGTMGNQLALRSLLTQPPYSVVCDHRSHIVKYEAGGYENRPFLIPRDATSAKTTCSVSSLTGAMTVPAIPSNGVHLTLEDIVRHAIVDDDVHSCPTRVISLENTLNGTVLPLGEVQRIAEFAQEHDIKLHCDGARLWEAVASGAGSLAEYCSHFDTVSLCFSKGLGAPIGSLLVGDTATIKHARWVRKSIGGGLRQSGVVAAPARVAVDVTFGGNSSGEGGLLRGSHETAKKVAKLWSDLGGKFAFPVHTNMCWLDLKSAGCSEGQFAEFGREVGLRLSGGRLVIHYQIAQNEAAVLPRLEAIFQRVLGENRPPQDQLEGGDSPSNMYRTKRARV